MSTIQYRVASLALMVPSVQAGEVGVSIHAQIDLLKDKDHMNLYHSSICINFRVKG